MHVGGAAADFLPQDFLGTDLAVPILRVTSLMMGLCLWGLSIWFFLVSVGSLWKYCKPKENMPFQMTWFSFVFPNTALVSQSSSPERHLLVSLGFLPKGPAAHPYRNES